MALYDNRHWLLSHIRNSFVSSDETGMWEAIIINEMPKDSNLFSKADMFPNIEDTDDEGDPEDVICNSFEIQSGGHRHRTNTAQRLKKMEQERQKAAKIKHVKWKYNPVPMTSEEREEMFEKKEIKKGKKILRSLLADEIEKCPFLPKNPFSEYAKFDGNAQVGVPTRTYKIFLTMLPRPERDFPLQVCVLGLAKVSELIGFVCWKYLTQNTDPNFTFLENVGCYGLFIAEDDGEVDWDFSCLDPKETVGKFGLAHLAMVELGDKNVPKKKIEEIKSQTIDSIVDKTAITKDSEDLKRIKRDLTAIEALLYQSFHVYIINKMRAKAEVVLGISGDKIEIDPVVQSHMKVGGKFWKQKAMSYDIHLIVSCELLESKSSNKVVFRIVHYTEQGESLTQSGHIHFKNHDFESDQQTAEEIVRKVNHILHLKCGVHRKEYLALKQKKLEKKNSFSIWPR